MQGAEGSGCLFRENRRPGNARRRDDRRCAVDLDDRHTVQVAHSEDQSKPGILAPAEIPVGPTVLDRVEIACPERAVTLR